jgi:hypothetical protein
VDEQDAGISTQVLSIETIDIVAVTVFRKWNEDALRELPVQYIRPSRDSFSTLEEPKKRVNIHDVAVYDCEVGCWEREIRGCGVIGDFATRIDRFRVVCGGHPGIPVKTLPGDSGEEGRSSSATDLVISCAAFSRDP